MVQEEQGNKAVHPSPGELLKSAREASGLSIEQVAEKLHLLQSIVSALEQDCYDRIRGETFVRGYMRNYARLLGINSDEVVGRYNAGRGTTGRQESRFSRRRDGLHGSSGAGRVGMVIALLAVSAAFLFFQREPAAAASADAAAQVTVETARGVHVVPLASASPVAR
jgi:cytoskeleton protein RodZ